MDTLWIFITRIHTVHNIYKNVPVVWILHKLVVQYVMTKKYIQTCSFIDNLFYPTNGMYRGASRL